MRVLLTLLLVPLMVACTSTPIETNRYLMRGPVVMGKSELNPWKDYGLGRLDLAPYINQQGLLLETVDNEIRPARYHLWAEPTRDSMRNLLAVEISRVSGRDLLPVVPDENTKLINISVSQFHGTQKGTAILVASWWLSQQGQVLAGFQFAEEIPLAEDGYASLAEAQSQLIMRLGSEIASRLDTESE